MEPSMNDICDDIRTATWYHATANPFWLEAVQAANVSVHVGTLAAAQVVGRDTINAARDTYSIAMEYDYDKEETAYGYWLYTVEIQSSAKVDDTPVEDACNYWMLHENRIYSKQTEVVPYVNQYEDKGNMSLLCSPHVLATTSRKWIPFGKGCTQTLIETFEVIIDLLDHNEQRGTVDGMNLPRELRTYVDTVELVKREPALFIG